MVDLDRREPQALEPRGLADLADEPRERVAGPAVAKAPEVDPGEHDLAVPLRDAAPDLAKHRVGGAASGAAADERDDAEVAREAAAVLDLHERPDPLEPGVVLHAAERAEVGGDRRRRLLAAAPNDDDVRRQAGEVVAFEVRAAAGDVHALVRARRTRGRLARLRERLVRDAAGVHDRDVCIACALHMPLREQPLAHVLRVEV